MSVPDFPEASRIIDKFAQDIDGEGFAATDIKSVGRIRQAIAKLLGNTVTWGGKTVLLDRNTKKEAAKFLERNTHQKPSSTEFVGKVLKSYISAKAISNAIASDADSPEADSIRISQKDFDDALAKVGIKNKDLRELKKALNIDSRAKEISLERKDFLSALEPRKNLIKSSGKRYDDFANELKRQCAKPDVTMETEHVATSVVKMDVDAVQKVVVKKETEHVGKVVLKKETEHVAKSVAKKDIDAVEISVLKKEIEHVARSVVKMESEQVDKTVSEPDPKVARILEQVAMTTGVIKRQVAMFNGKYNEIFDKMKDSTYNPTSDLKRLLANCKEVRAQLGALLKAAEGNPKLTGIEIFSSIKELHTQLQEIIDRPGFLYIGGPPFTADGRLKPDLPITASGRSPAFISGGSLRPDAPRDLDEYKKAVEAQLAGHYAAKMPDDPEFIGSSGADRGLDANNNGPTVTTLGEGFRRQYKLELAFTGTRQSITEAEANQLKKAYIAFHKASDELALEVNHLVGGPSAAVRQAERNARDRLDAVKAKLGVNLRWIR